MEIKITRDQAVWESETFTVSIPDDTPAEDIESAVRTAVYQFQGYHEDGYDKQILDEPVYGIDVETTGVLPSGVVLRL